jgi:hypothetical protein
VVVAAGAAEHLRLDVVDVLGDAVNGLLVAVHDQVRGPVQHTGGAVLEELRAGQVELGAHPAQHVGLAVPDRHHEAPAEEDGQLGDVDDLVVVDVADRLEHHEQHVVVGLELGPLVRLDGVLDRQVRQPELVGYRGDVLGGGLLQPDPDEPARAAGDLAGLAKWHPPWAAVPVLVHAAVTDDLVQVPLRLDDVRLVDRCRVVGRLVSASGSPWQHLSRRARGTGRPRRIIARHHRSSRGYHPPALYEPPRETSSSPRASTRLGTNRT